MAADTHINLSNRLLIVSMVSEVMSYISSNSSQNSNSIREDKAMDSVVRLLASRVKAHESYVVYLKLRAEQTSNVVWNPFSKVCKMGTDKTPPKILALLTHEDASISADVAKSNHELAEHAKRDSSTNEGHHGYNDGVLAGRIFCNPSCAPDVRLERGNHNF
ncbi:hypothetical protein F4823DRAFT_564895 [Ustulina deusta]|nr:hypothetical protein F4823DRAFT_564895 [Ustulina deusta]